MTSEANGTKTNAGDRQMKTQFERGTEVVIKPECRDSSRTNESLVWFVDSDCIEGRVVIMNDCFDHLVINTSDIVLAN